VLYFLDFLFFDAAEFVDQPGLVYRPDVIVIGALTE